MKMKINLNNCRAFYPCASGTDIYFTKDRTYVLGKWVEGEFVKDCEPKERRSIILSSMHGEGRYSQDAFFGWKEASFDFHFDLYSPDIRYLLVLTESIQKLEDK